jgi:hypothetical protein
MIASSTKPEASHANGRSTGPLMPSAQGCPHIDRVQQLA